LRPIGDIEEAVANKRYVRVPELILLRFGDDDDGEYEWTRAGHCFHCGGVQRILAAE
jgi:hypothetical protein